MVDLYFGGLKAANLGINIGGEKIRTGFQTARIRVLANALN